MKQWEIYTFDFVPEGPHPVVILSSNPRVNFKDRVNVLICSSQRANRPPRITEALLDREDGLVCPLSVKCDLTYLVPKDKLYGHRGKVTPTRRRVILDTLLRSFELRGL